MKYHRYNLKGTKFVMVCDIGTKPDPIIEEGYTEWQRGEGPPIEIKKKKKKKKLQFKKKRKTIPR